MSLSENEEIHELVGMKTLSLTQALKMRYPELFVQ